MLQPAFIQNIGIGGLLVILVIVLLLFGPGRLPQVFEMLGKSVKSFRDGQRDDLSNSNAPRDSSGRMLSEAEEAEELRTKSEARETERR